MSDYSIVIVGNRIYYIIHNRFAQFFHYYLRDFIPVGINISIINLKDAMMSVRRGNVMISTHLYKVMVNILAREGIFIGF